MLKQQEPVNLFAPEVLVDPFPTYALIRERGPLCPVEPGNFWAVSHYADVAMVLKDAEHFSSAGFRPAFEPPWVGRNPAAHSILLMDPPEHGKNRALVNRVFAPGVISRVEPEIRARIARLADSLVDRDAVEVVGEFAIPISTGVIGDFLALDPHMHTQFRVWLDVIGTITPEPPSPERAAYVREQIAEMERYFGEVIAERQRAPGTDVLSMLAQANVDGQTLTDDELVGFLFLLLAAGLETSGSLISKLLLTLARRPDLLDRLRAAPELIPRFIEEQLRYDPSIHNLFRLATQDLTIAGVDVPAGTCVMVMLAAANRDPAQFSDPDRFDLDRSGQDTIVFGHGPHFCLGAALARLEARATLEELLTRFQRFELLVDPIEWKHTLTVRGPSYMSMRFVPA